MFIKGALVEGYTKLTSTVASRLEIAGTERSNNGLQIAVFERAMIGAELLAADRDR